MRIIFLFIVMFTVSFANAQDYNTGQVTDMTKEYKISSNNTEKEQVLEAYKTFQQAMIDKDIKKLYSLVTEDVTFTHMSGKKQTKENFFEEIENGTLNYFKYDIENPVIKIYDNYANLKSVTTLIAKVYGMSGKWSLNTDAWFVKTQKGWIYCNKPENIKK